MNAETWVPASSSLLRRPREAVWADLRGDGCFNVRAAACVLRVKQAEAGGDRWDAAGRHNSATPHLKSAHQARLLAAFGQLFRRRHG